jgi:hypothetical protein
VQSGDAATHVSKVSGPIVLYVSTHRNWKNAAITHPDAMCRPKGGRELLHKNVPEAHPLRYPQVPQVDIH